MTAKDLTPEQVDEQFQAMTQGSISTEANQDAPYEDAFKELTEKKAHLVSVLNSDSIEAGYKLLTDMLMELDAFHYDDNDNLVDIGYYRNSVAMNEESLEQMKQDVRDTGAMWEVFTTLRHSEDYSDSITDYFILTKDELIEHDIAVESDNGIILRGIGDNTPESAVSVYSNWMMILGFMQNLEDWVTDIDTAIDTVLAESQSKPTTEPK